MSDTPPPLPIKAIPVEPVAVESIRFDQPYNPAPGRPGMITAIGVFSIIVAVGSLILTLLIALIAPFYLRLSRVTTSMSGQGSPSYVLPPQKVAGAPLNGPDRVRVMEVFDDALRRAVGAAPQGDRRRLLGAMLDRAGQTIVASTGGAFSPQTLELEQVRAGRMPGAESGSDNGADFVALPAGRVELYDSRAVFFPQQGRAVRVTLDELDETVPDGSGVLPPKYLAAVAQQAAALSQGRVTEKQSAELERNLTVAGQGYVIDLSSPQASAAALHQVTFAKQGSILLHFAGGGMEIDPAGKLSRTWVGSEVPTVGTASALLVIDHILSALLAAFLIVAAVTTLRQSRYASRLLWGYALTRLVLAAATGAIWYYYFKTASALYDAHAGYAGGNFPDVWLMTSIVAGITCLYPLTLMLVLRLPTIRAYFTPRAV